MYIIRSKQVNVNLFLLDNHNDLCYTVNSINTISKQGDTNDHKAQTPRQMQCIRSIRTLETNWSLR